MSVVEHYEILVLGSRGAGKFLAWTLAKAGHRTAVVERKWLGGSCPNVACLPIGVSMSRKDMSGNSCRCSAYPNIVAGVKSLRQ